MSSFDMCDLFGVEVMVAAGFKSQQFLLTIGLSPHSSTEERRRAWLSSLMTRQRRQSWTVLFVQKDKMHPSGCGPSLPELPW